MHGGDRRGTCLSTLGTDDGVGHSRSPGRGGGGWWSCGCVRCGHACGVRGARPDGFAGGPIVDVQSSEFVKPMVCGHEPTMETVMHHYQLTHLQQLEAESIHIIREVATEFAKPVMLYSIGKDSAVMLRLAQKAFHPGPIPFPLMHVDTLWKFREMIQFRENVAKELGIQLLVWTNPEGKAQNINPIDHGSEKHTHIMKTEALKQALTHHGFDAAFGGARRDEEKSRAKERVFSFRNKFHQ